MRRKNGGITLIALVITIIVLLILAGVTISLLIGDNGIILKVTNAKQNMENATGEEQEGLQEIEEILGVGLKPEEEIQKVIKNPETYLERAQEQGQTRTDVIGIGTDGKIVNMDLWRNFVTDDGEGMSLGKGGSCGHEVGYVGSFVDGVLESSVPQYIYVVLESKAYPVVGMEATFKGMEGLKQFVDIPSTVVYLTSTFDGTNVKQIHIPSSVVRSEGTIQNCKDLEKVSIDGMLVELRGEFLNCPKLMNVSLPSSLEQMYVAFQDCPSLRRVVIPSRVSRLELSFIDCESLEEVKFMGVRPEMEFSFINCPLLDESFD